MNKNLIKSLAYYSIGILTITLGIIYSKDIAMNLFYDYRSINHIPITPYQINGIVVFFSIVGLTFILNAVRLFIDQQKKD